VKGYLIAISIVVLDKKAPNILVLLPLIRERKPGEAPRHLSIRAPSGERLPARADLLRSIVSNFVFTESGKYMRALRHSKLLGYNYASRQN
jgi:hypothetical protein